MIYSNHDGKSNVRQGQKSRGTWNAYLFFVAFMDLCGFCPGHFNRHRNPVGNAFFFFPRRRSSG